MTGTDAVWVLPDQVFDGETLRGDVAVACQGGRGVRVVAARDVPVDAAKIRLSGIVSPGFVDLQVNGGGGVLFNQNPTPEGIATIAAAHRKFGTVALLATVITDARRVLAQAVDAVLQVVAEPGVLGIHIEGPHISLARKGTHSAQFVRPLDEVTMAHVQRLRDKQIPVMITLAPEAASARDIARLADMGAVVSIGHSDAPAEQTRAALDAGARCFTHLFNAMSPMQGRAPGVVGAAINSRAHAGIICDGIHVADEMVALAIRARAVRNRMFLVSDAMPTVGGATEFDLYGETVTLKNGRLENQNGVLAGAHTTMFQSVGRLVENVGIGAELALRMATSVPLGLMLGDEIGPMLVGRDLTDIVLVDAEFTNIETLGAALARRG